ncbi:hypothetical protein GCM10009117_04150 [Gangjinia marincola]|uniref:M23ase beta-sheet core domain-containing protein n=1 Tax=Gangjinia marincola TaxID=578463 RepID=A0ABN1MDV0_9FLAO
MNFDAFLHSLTSSFTPVIDSSFNPEDYIHVDLSPSNALLNQVNLSSAEDIELFLENFLRQNQKKVAYGGYLEKRSIYDRSEHFSSGSSVQRRNIHLGMDVWCAANTSVLLPLDGKIHSVRNNKNFGDYGPTIIVEHQENEQTFYTLYGHLSLESLDRLNVGVKVVKGEKLGELGDATVNGNYAPHLHFQLIKDMHNHAGDYPGVCTKAELKFYSSNCPDPNTLLKIY